MSSTCYGNKWTGSHFVHKNGDHKQGDPMLIVVLIHTLNCIDASGSSCQSQTFAVSRLTIAPVTLVHIIL